MTDGHRTSSIPRARRAGEATSATVATSGRRGKPLGELTRPIARSRQLVTGRGKRFVIGLAAIGVLVALLAALFVLPVKAWMRQRDDLNAKQHELDVLRQANDELAAEVARLNTPAGAAEAAREEIGVVAPGEQRVSVLPPPAAGLTLPSGWPYDVVTQIVAVRAQQASDATSTTAAPAATEPAVTDGTDSTDTGAPGTDLSGTDVTDPATADTGTPTSDTGGTVPDDASGG